MASSWPKLAQLGLKLPQVGKWKLLEPQKTKENHQVTNIPIFHFPNLLIFQHSILFQYTNACPMKMESERHQHCNILLKEAPQQNKIYIYIYIYIYKYIWVYDIYFFLPHCHKCSLRVLLTTAYL